MLFTQTHVRAHVEGLDAALATAVKRKVAVAGSIFLV